MAKTATRNLGRVSEIAQVAVKHGFGYFFETHRLTDLLPGRANRATADGASSERGQHLRRHRRRPRGEEVALHRH